MAAERESRERVRERWRVGLAGRGEQAGNEKTGLFCSLSSLGCVFKIKLVFLTRNLVSGQLFSV